ncbi:MAG: hypothetical protein LBS36_03775 [Oscillospiraceae bacterium]|jgi:hypothetical protein|nr:hypothetical protein [Oscillospiraceae bacterium]
MIGKVLKYDIRSIGKTLLPVYGVTVLLCAFTRLMVFLETYSSVFGMFGMLTNVFSLIAVAGSVALTLFICVRRFYVHLFKEQGYLTNMLPVKLETLVFSKFAVSLLFSVGAAALAIGSLALMYASLELTPNITEFVNVVKSVFPIFFVLIILSLYLYQSGAYAAYSIGQRSGRNKIGSAFAAYLLLYFVYQIMNLIVLLVVYFAWRDLWTLLEQNDMHAVKNLLYVAAIPTVIANIGCYFVSVRFLKKQMDLE